jgi:hypothetical protein
MLGQPSIFRAFILQHHDEVELSCTSPVAQKVVPKTMLLVLELEKVLLV